MSKATNKARSASINYVWEVAGFGSKGYIEPHGHRLFFSCMTGAYALADDSGKFPELTDDGPLWINVSALKESGSIQIEIGPDDHKAWARIPVFKSSVPPSMPEATEGYYVGVGIDGAAYLARKFNVALEVTTSYGMIGTLVITKRGTP